MNVYASELQKPLHETGAHVQTGSKYYIRSQPTCLCFKHNISVSRTWGSAPVLQVEETCGDCIINSFFGIFPMLCCGGLKYSVSGMVSGDANFNPVNKTSVFKASGMPGSVGVDSRVSTRLMTSGWKSLCMRWVFTTSGGTVDYFTANAETGQDMLHIHRGTTSKANSCLCCFVPAYICCSNYCVKESFTCCPGGYASTTEVKGGDRLAPGGPPTVGTLTSGMEKSCCGLCQPCKPIGGVITVPQELDANSLMSWVLLWNSSLTHHLYSQRYRHEFMPNWTERPIGRVEEMM